MQPWEIAAITLTVIVVSALIGWIVYDQKRRQYRRQHLREHFGPEYDRTVAELGDQGLAESDLSRREEHIRKAKIRPLTVEERRKFSEQWRSCQARFVDDPLGAVRQADDLVTDVMRARGYSFGSHQERLEDISAAYPGHIEHCRLAEAVVLRTNERVSTGGEPSTEDLRNAFVHYRALFAEMLEVTDEEYKRAS
jgi:hypothetical protein